MIVTWKPLLNILKQAGKFGTKPDFYGTTTGVLSKNLEKAPLFSNQRIREVIRPYTSGIMETTKAAGRGTKDFFKKYGIAAGTGGGLGTGALFGLGDYLEEDTPKKEIDEYSDIEFLGPGSEEDKVAKILPGETALDAVLREGKVIAQKRKDDKNKNIPSKTGKTEKINIDAEDSFEADFNKMQSRLEKYFGSSKAEDKGMIAIALSDAIGTPGSIADKATQLNKSLLKIAAGKKKDKKEIAKLAFAAAADLEAIREKRLEPSEAEKRRRRFINLKTRFDKGLLTDASEIAEFEAIRGELRMLPKSITVNEGITIGAAAGEIMDDIAEYNDEKTSKSDKEKLLTEIKGGISSLLLNEKLNKDILGNAYPQLRPFLKDGGRIGMALGGATETPAEPVDNTLNFEQLRTRLPSEITDDIVRLISTSEQALQDFAYIRTQGDVEKFNIKYGVNLVLPQNTI